MTVMEFVNRFLNNELSKFLNEIDVFMTYLDDFVDATPKLTMMREIYIDAFNKTICQLKKNMATICEKFELNFNKEQKSKVDINNWYVYYIYYITKYFWLYSVFCIKNSFLFFCVMLTIQLKYNTYIYRIRYTISDFLFFFNRQSWLDFSSNFLLKRVF